MNTDLLTSEVREAFERIARWTRFLGWLLLITAGVVSTSWVFVPASLTQFPRWMRMTMFMSVSVNVVTGFKLIAMKRNMPMPTKRDDAWVLPYSLDALASLFTWFVGAALASEVVNVVVATLFADTLARDLAKLSRGAPPIEIVPAGPITGVYAVIVLAMVVFAIVAAATNRRRT